jgi:hypothetical protein
VLLPMFKSPRRTQVRGFLRSSNSTLSRRFRLCLNPTSSSSCCKCGPPPLDRYCGDGTADSRLTPFATITGALLRWPVTCQNRACRGHYGCSGVLLSAIPGVPSHTRGICPMRWALGDIEHDDRLVVITRFILFGVAHALQNPRIRALERGNATICTSLAHTVHPLLAFVVRLAVTP